MKVFVISSMMLCLSSSIWGQASSDDIVNHIENNMVEVKGGTFMMGQTHVVEDESKIITRVASSTIDDDSPRADELPAHRVTVSDFRICKYELTQEEWTAVMSSNPSYFRGVNVPLESAKWDEIQNFISRLNEMTGHKYRLPTEAEWEFAERGGNLSCDYRYSGSNNPDEVAWYAADSLEQMQPVGKKKPNELGLYDMSGNAFEWCNDWYGPYGEEHQIAPKGPERGTYHVLRGGSWKHSSNGLRVSFRTHIPTTHLNKCGFRLAEEVEKETVITTVSNKDNGIKQFYNLQGLLLAKKPQKGTYICKEWDREKQNWVIRKITAK